MTPEAGQIPIETRDEGAAPARLILLSGREKGAVYPLPKNGEFVVGRAEASHLVLDDTEVSRRHCTITGADGTYRLRDNGSTNGSFVNGVRVAEAPLESGAKVRIGQVSFVLVLADETRPVPAAAELAEADWPAKPPDEREAPPRDSAVLADSPAAGPGVPARLTAALRERNIPDDERGRREPAVAGRVRRRRRRRSLLLAAAFLVATVAAVLGSGAWDFLGHWGLGISGGTRSVTVSSTPLGAEVVLDNTFVGLAPVTLQVGTRGPHALRLVKRGYQTWRAAIESGSPSDILATLEPEPSATLLVSATKPDTDVYLDGNLVGKTGDQQPLTIPDVKLGQHELRLQRPNYVPYCQQIDVTRSGQIHIHGKLESRQESSLLALIAKDPKSALLYTELGHACLVDKQLDKGMDAYRQALELVYSGKDTSGYHTRLTQEIQKVMMGDQGLFRYGTEEETLVACQKLEDVFVSLAPRYPPAKANLNALVTFYTGKQRVDDAIRLYHKMLAADPEAVDLYYEIATLCESKNDYEAAITVLKQAADRFTDNWKIQYRIGLAYSRRAASDRSANDKRLAIEHLQAAERLCSSEAYKRNVQYYLDKVKNLKVE